MEIHFADLLEGQLQGYCRGVPSFLPVTGYMWSWSSSTGHLWRGPGWGPRYAAPMFTWDSWPPVLFLNSNNADKSGRQIWAVDPTCEGGPFYKQMLGRLK